MSDAMNRISPRLNRGIAMVEFTIVDGRVLFDRSEANTLRKISTQTPGGR